jgi:hypothetical protein
VPKSASAKKRECQKAIQTAAAAVWQLRRSAVAPFGTSQQVY